MFSEGQRVWVINKKCWATLEGYDPIGEYAYLRLDNGVEMDCSTRNIQSEEQHMLSTALVDEKGDPEIAALYETIKDKWPNLISLGIHTHTQMTAAVTKLGGSPTPWNRLNPSQRLNYTCLGLQLDPDHLFETWKAQKLEGIRRFLLSKLP